LNESGGSRDVESLGLRNCDYDYGSTIVYAQQGPAVGRVEDTAKDMAAFTDARIAALHAGLELNPEAGPRFCFLLHRSTSPGFGHKCNEPLWACPRARHTRLLR
jgi:hypothetical protein